MFQSSEPQIKWRVNAFLTRNNSRAFSAQETLEIFNYVKDDCWELPSSTMSPN